MSQAFRLPFSFQINAPLNSVLVKPKQTTTHNKELSFVLKRIFRVKLKAIFKTIKNSEFRSAESLMRSLLLSMRQNRKQIKISYLPYSVSQVNNNQPPVPKTLIFNSRVKNIKINAFLKLKKFFYEVKSYQVSTILQNRQNELLNHLIPKIQEKVYTYAFRKIVEHSKQEKGKHRIIRLLDKLANNVVKRVFYIDFLNRIKKYRTQQAKQKLCLKKIIKIIKTNEKFILQTAFRKISSFQKYVSLETKLTEKKQRISKIYDLNAERTVILQKQRQILRNLKYKLDHQAVQKNHVLTDKRRSLMLARTKLHQESKHLNDQLHALNCQASKFQKVFEKQTWFYHKLQKNRKHVKDLKRTGADFEFITLMMYKTIDDLMNQDNVNTLVELVRVQQNRSHQIDGFPMLDLADQSRQYLCKKINLLQRVVKAYQKKQPKSLNGSMIRPITQSMSSSHLRVSPSVATLKGSLVLGNSNVINRAKNMDPQQLIRLKEQFSQLQGLISFILSKSYELRIKEAITAQIEQLTELLAKDLKDQ